MLKDPTGERYSPYYDNEGNLLGLDEHGWAGNIYITTQEAFDRSATNGVANSKILQANKATKFISSFAGLSDEALAKIYTSILSETGFVDLSKLHNGSISVYNGSSIGGVGQGYNNPLRITSGRAQANSNFGGKINVTVRSDAKTDFNTVESVQSFLGIHEYKGHGIFGYDGYFQPGDRHYKSYMLQAEHPTFNRLSESHRQDIINKTFHHMYYENRGAYNRHESSNSNLFQLYRKYKY